MQYIPFLILIRIKYIPSCFDHGEKTPNYPFYIYVSNPLKVHWKEDIFSESYMLRPGAWLEESTEVGGLPLAVEHGGDPGEGGRHEVGVEAGGRVHGSWRSSG